MRKTLLILFLSILALSCEKLEYNYAKHISGTYQAREISVSGLTLNLPDNQTGLSIDLFISEFGAKSVSILLEMTIDGEREVITEFVDVIKDGSRYYLEADGGTFEISGNQAIMEMDLNGELARVVFRKL